MSDETDDTKLTSVKYYRLNDENAYTFYEEWRFKTMAILRKKGWSGQFEKPTVIPTATEASATNATAETKKIFSDNAEAYDQILMGCSGIALGLVKRAQGNSVEAISNLDSKYGTTKTDLTTTLNNFANCKLKSKDEDPDKWFMDLDKLNDKLEEIDPLYKKRSFEIKAHILGGLPDGYEDVKTKVSGKEDDYTVRELEDEIRNKWKRDHKSNDETNEYALSIEHKGKGKRRFKGKCRKCGKQGHKAVDCKSNKQGVCFECGEDGHFARNCPKKNASKLGMFVGVTMSVNEKESGTSNKYLMDSGASCHVVADESSLTDLKEINDSIVIGDKSEMKVNKEGTLNLKTEEGSTLKLERVKLVPGIAKNIVSVGRLMESGNKVVMTNEVMTIENKEGSKLEINPTATHLCST